MKLQHIKETLNRPVAWTYTGIQYGKNLFTFKVNNKPFILTTFQQNKNEPDIEVQFFRDDLKGTNRIGITNDGDAFVVFATIIDILKNLLQKLEAGSNHKSTPKIIFTADEPNRRKLYKSLVNKFKRLGGWEGGEIRRGVFAVWRKETLS